MRQHAGVGRRIEAIDFVAEAPHGAHPSYAQDYYDRDNEYYRAWDAIGKDRDAFQRWVEDEVMAAEGSAV